MSISQDVSSFLSVFNDTHKHSTYERVFVDIYTILNKIQHGNLDLELFRTLDTSFFILNTLPSDFLDSFQPFFSHIQELLVHSPFVRHLIQKPYGYPGDFQAMIYISKQTITHPLDHYAHSITACQANRYRNHFFASQLESINPSFLASIGCGPCIEILDFLQKTRSDCQISLFDMELDALEYAHALLSPFSTHIKLFYGNILKTIFASEDHSFDCLLISGLLDYFSQESASKLLSKLWQKLKPSGSLLACNAVQHYSSYFITNYLMDWKMDFKSEIEFKSLFLGLNSIETGHYHVDKFNCYQYAILKKS